MRRVAIFGATSAIAQATARVFAEAGDTVYLVARDREKLDDVTQLLRESDVRCIECVDAFDMNVLFLDPRIECN